MPALFTNIASLFAYGSLALASIIAYSGSSPRASGTRMLAPPDYGVSCTICGGRYKAEIIQWRHGVAT